MEQGVLALNERLPKGDEGILVVDAYEAFEQNEQIRSNAPNREKCLE